MFSIAFLNKTFESKFISSTKIISSDEKKFFLASLAAVIAAGLICGVTAPGSLLPNDIGLGIGIGLSVSALIDSAIFGEKYRKRYHKNHLRQSLINALDQRNRFWWSTYTGDVMMSPKSAAILRSLGINVPDCSVDNRSRWEEN